MHRAEVTLRTRVLGEPANQNIRPLSEQRYVGITCVHQQKNYKISTSDRAIENGANALAEGFLFTVAVR